MTVPPENPRPTASGTELEGALRTLHAIASRPKSAEEGIQAIMDMGLQRFGLSSAIVAQIDPALGSYRVTLARGKGGVSAGDEFELADTFCREVVERGECIAVDRVETSEWKGHPCQTRFEVEAYVGIPLRVEGQPFGTLSFVDAKPSEREFTPADREILTLMSDWIGGELARQAARRVAEGHDAGLRELVATTQDAVVFMDGRGKILLFNPAAESTFGYASEEVIGQDVSMLMAQPYAREHTEYVRRYEETGEKRAIGQIRTVSARRKSGQVFPIELSVTAMGNHGTARYGAFIRDISEKNQLQDRLVERERLAVIGTTAAMFAHEIGNPLNSMSLQLQLLQRRVARDGEIDGEVVAEKARLVRGELQRLIQLLTEFRSLSRRQQFQFELQDVGMLLDQLVHAQRASYETRGVPVRVELAEGVPKVRVDADKFTQVVLNLCKNAVEALDGAPGELVLSAYTVDDFVHVDIKDTGPGIPEDVDVFQPFVTTKAAGTGLGLPIVKQILEAHDGSVSYESVAGEGTTFTLRLPLHRPDVRSQSLQ